MKTDKFKDIHKGQIGFISGSGPSLHSFTEEQIDKIQQFPLIAVNSAIMKFPKAKYYLSDDIAVSNWNYYIELLPKLPCIKLLYKDKLKNKCDHLDDCYLFSHTWWYSPKDNKYNLDGLKLNKTGPIIGARTSVSSGVHFLFLMGCNPIVLLGCNCCYSKEGYRYFWQYEGEQKAFRVNGDKSIGFPGRKKYMGEQIDNHSLDFLQYWNYFVEVNKDILGKDLTIINCSDGLLDCFPRMKIEEVLKTYK